MPEKPIVYFLRRRGAFLLYLGLGNLSPFLIWLWLFSKIGRKFCFLFSGTNPARCACVTASFSRLLKKRPLFLLSPKYGCKKFMATSGNLGVFLRRLS